MNIIKPCLARRSSTMVLIVLVTCYYSYYAHVFHFTGPFAFFNSTAAFYCHSADDLLEWTDSETWPKTRFLLVL